MNVAFLKFNWLVVHCCVAAVTVMLSASGCSSDTDETADPTAGAPMEDIPNEDVGAIHFRNASKRLGNLVQPGGRGVALVDFDQDGWPDVTILAQNEIHRFRGVGDGLFLPFGAPIEFDFGMAATWADVDGDGDLDLYVSSAYEQHGLFQNDGTGQLVDVTTAAGFSEPMPAGGQGASFGDVDGDGDLDLYLCFGLPPPEKIPDDMPPLGEGGSPNRLYINDGAGRFSRGDESVAGIPSGETFMGLWFDADDDGDVDLLVVHDASRDEYFTNHDGVLIDESAQRLPGGGNEPSSIMGVDIADFDGDGDLDLYGTQRGNDVLWVAQEGRFVNTWGSRIQGYDPSPQVTGWGGALVDVDNDGDLDVLATSNYETIFDPDSGGTGGLRTGWMMLLETKGNGVDREFSDASDNAGSVFTRPIDGFGFAVGDIDRDGDIDALVGIDGSGDKADPDAHQSPLLMLNDGTASADHGYLSLTVRQSGTNSFAVGGSVEVLGLGVRTRRPIMAGTSYLSSHSYRLHFGLAHYERAPAVKVRWPGGGSTLWLNLPKGEHRLERPTDMGNCCTASGCEVR
ncbi:MAG: hypothetical protein ACI9OJ_004497, partial [Myxococcota bacterium]